MSLQSPRKDDAEWPAVVVTTFDKEFLYIGASCRKPKGAVYTADTQPRTMSSVCSGVVSRPSQALA